MPAIHSHIKLTLQIPESHHEILIAELMDLDFEGFECTDDQLMAWIESRHFDDFRREQIEQILFQVDPELSIHTEVVEDRNWNEIWESTIQPIRIGKFLIRPTWSTVESDNETVELIIDPKMSFGTGSHATTSLMLDFLDRHSVEGFDVLDAGTGTGILAIAAKKMGAQSVFAFDIDPWSEENTLENLERNEISEGIEVFCGGFEVIPENRTFDLILANIDSGVIKSVISLFKTYLKPGAELVLSGLLTAELDGFLRLFELHQFKLIEHKTEKEWSLFHLLSS